MTDETPSPGVFTVAVKGGGLKMDKEVDQTTVLAVVNLLMGGDVAPPVPPADEENGGTDTERGVSPKPQRRRRTPTAKKGRTKRAGKAKSVGLDKDLSLRPKNKKSFADFVNEKKPSNHEDKVTVCVFWLSKVAGHNATPEAVNSCYEGRAGSVPPTCATSSE